MYLLGGLIGLIGATFLYDAYKNGSNKGKSIIWGIILLVIGLVIFIGLSASNNSSSTSSKWNNLTNEEKQWYTNNYGNGKSEQYRNAINNYKKSH